MLLTTKAFSKTTLDVADALRDAGDLGMTHPQLKEKLPQWTGKQISLSLSNGVSNGRFKHNHNGHSGQHGKDVIRRYYLVVL